MADIGIGIVIRIDCEEHGASEEVDCASTMKLLVVFIPLLLGGCVSGPPNNPGAEVALRRIEEALRSARGVRIKYRLTGEEMHRPFAGTGSLFLAPGNRMCHEFSGNRMGKPWRICAISDGRERTSGWHLGTGIATRLSVEDTLGQDVALWTARLGPFGTEGRMPPPPYRDAALRQARQVVGIQWASGGTDLPSLTYEVEFAGWPMHSRYQVILTYDPQAYVPLKHEIRERVVLSTCAGLNLGWESAYTLRYDEFALDVEIPEEKFKLPADK